MTRHTKYLGLPSLITMNMKDTFAQIRTKVSRVVARWKNKLLSTAGKEFLIKSIAHAIPNYTMSLFRLPKGIVEDIHGLYRNFWQGFNKSKNQIHKKSCKGLCMPKAIGSLGFRDVELFNRALLAKQVWHLILNLDSLAFRVLRSQYFPRGNTLRIRLGYAPSYMWRSLF